MLARESRSAAGRPGREVRNCAGQYTLMRHLEFYPFVFFNGVLTFETVRAPPACAAAFELLPTSVTQTTCTVKVRATPDVQGVRDVVRQVSEPAKGMDGTERPGRGPAGPWVPAVRPDPQHARHPVRRMASGRRSWSRIRSAIDSLPSCRRWPGTSLAGLRV